MVLNTFDFLFVVRQLQPPGPEWFRRLAGFDVPATGPISVLAFVRGRLDVPGAPLEHFTVLGDPNLDKLASPSLMDVAREHDVSTFDVGVLTLGLDVVDGNRTATTVAVHVPESSGSQYSPTNDELELDPTRVAGHRNHCPGAVSEGLSKPLSDITFMPFQNTRLMISLSETNDVFRVRLVKVSSVPYYRV